MHGPKDPLLATFAEACDELMRGQLDTGKELLGNLSFSVASRARRRRLSIRDRSDIFDRDRYQCGYCGEKLVLPELLRLVAEVCPEEFPYHLQGKANKIHPLAARWRAEIDHVIPVARGADRYDGANLVTSCSSCNRRKGSLLLSEIPEMSLISNPADPSWDGLSRYLDILWQQYANNFVVPTNIALAITNWRREIRARRPVFVRLGNDPYDQGTHHAYRQPKRRKGSLVF